MRTPDAKDTDMIFAAKPFPEFNTFVPVVFYEKTETWACPQLGHFEKMSWHDLRKKIFRHLAAQRQLELQKQIDSDLTQV